MKYLQMDNLDRDAWYNGHARVHPVLEALRLISLAYSVITIDVFP